MELSSIFLQAGGAGGQQWMQFVFIGGIVLIFYFFMIRPQQQKQKKQKEFAESIKKGDQVVTMGGIHGKVASVEGNMVFVEVDRGVKLKLDKNFLSFEHSNITAPKDK